MRSILSSLLHDPFQALVDLWCVLRRDYPRFQAAEQATIRDPDGHRRVREGVLRALETGAGLRARNLPGGPDVLPLAVLQALDDYLSLRAGTFGPGPPTIRRASAQTFEFIVYRRPLPRPEGAVHARQTGHLQGWLSRHWVIARRIAGIEVDVKTAQSPLWADLERIAAAGEVAVFVGSFADGVLPAWLPQEPPGWLAEGLTAPEVRWSSTLQALDEAKQAGARVVIFPELTLCPDLRGRVAQWLDDHEAPFLLVLPGSFHVRGGGSVHNVCELLDRFGVPVLRHRKLTTFNNGDGEERIATGSRIELLATPLGLVCTPICLDFCEEGSPFNSLWEEIGAGWLLVPAFGGEASMRAHRRRAEVLFRAHGSVSVVANQDPAGRDQCYGFAKHDACEPEPATPGGRVARVKLSGGS